MPTWTAHGARQPVRAQAAITKYMPRAIVTVCANRSQSAACFLPAAQGTAPYRFLQGVADFAQQHDVFRRTAPQPLRPPLPRGSSELRIRFIRRTIWKMMKARMRKFSRMVRKLP
jgi:hypothetical protein